ncbi:MAG: hypothetical protein K0S76_454 [Herbinix sp.]|nr:hypothetical protein [Herbinix sp.]
MTQEQEFELYENGIVATNNYLKMHHIPKKKHGLNYRKHHRNVHCYCKRRAKRHCRKCELPFC